MATTATPRLVTRPDFARKMRPDELATFDLCAHEAGHAVRGVLRGGEVTAAGVFGGRVAPLHGRTRFREAFTRDHIPTVAWSGPWSQARWIAGDRPTPGQVDSVLAAGGCHDHDQMLRAYAGSGGAARVDHAAENHLLQRCWPSVLALASKIYTNGEVDHLAVLEALGLTRDTAAFGLASIRSGSTPLSFRLHTPFTRF
ncbi:hypothetical protein R2325_16195 [Mycobacteroides chelonae]|nr:hypothetical protein [Mycobacteroides chelonae]MEC4873529.1 hypothetical protein [Mycobacteroides chelonae]